MSQSRRLGQLNAAESWLNNYRYLTNANFKAYDFDSLRAALLLHIQTNYPEDFNDFINSSEYVGLIDLMAFIGQNLAFRSDLNLRETFLETAEVRGNVLSIARQLGYKPFRNGGASGFLRLKAINTTQNIYDSKGNNLAGQTIVWGDPLNYDFSEQFITIINQVLNKSNPVGRPISSIVDNGTIRQLYQVDQLENRTMVETLGLPSRNNTTYPCEIIPVNIDLDTQLSVESEPNPYGYLSMLFNNDGTGYANTGNGWFFMFKQGSLKFEDYVITNLVENRVIDIQTDNINETDIWVQSIDGDGRILSTWTPVPSTVGKNIIFNGVDKDTRNLYEVITRENDSVSIKFGDGTFSNIPTGNIRVWFRQSANESVVFSPLDVAGTQIALRYLDSTGASQDLICTLELTDISASTPTETLSQIKNRASRTAASQERMITASDYNVYPEGKVGGIDKIKAVNRTHAGQSMFTDFQDPTGTYRPVISLADDAFVYSTEIIQQYTVNGDMGKEEVFSWMENLLLERGIHQLYYRKYQTVMPTDTVYWMNTDSANSASHGYFTLDDGAGLPLRIGKGNPDLLYRTIKKNTLIKTIDGKWSKILDVYREGFGLTDNAGTNTGLRANGQGAVFLNTIIDADAPLRVTEWFPSLRSIFAPTEKIEILKEIDSFRSFGLRYDQTFDRWRIIRADNIDTVNNFSLTRAGDNTNQSLDASWLIRMNYDTLTGTWSATTRKDQTVLGSINQLAFYNQRFGKGIDQSARKIITDHIKILKINEDITEELELDIADYFKLDDGRYDSNRVILLMPGMADGLVPNDPYIIDRLLGTRTLMLERLPYLDAVGQYTLKPVAGETTNPKIGPLSGRQGIKIQYNHVPLRDTRVNATTTNIMDMFVLTSEYNATFRTWVAGGARTRQKPLALDSYSLGVLMADIIPYKSVSDTIIFHPVKYKIIFGPSSTLRNQVKIRVTKTDGTKISDAEIRSRVIQSINDYFSVDNWDFGESFFFTDMASWVHAQLNGMITSIALIPRQNGLTPNDMFQIRCEDDELLISSATVSDVEVINSTMSITTSV